VTRAGRAAIARTALAGALLLCPPAGAAPDARAQAEIDQLLAAIASSGCTFVRAGRDYTGAEAREHLQRKYSQVRDRLATAEDFIVHVASASSMTGEAYRVRCAGAETSSGPWLRGALDRLRARR
jgi:hypothetical protein